MLVGVSYGAKYVDVSRRGNQWIQNRYLNHSIVKFYTLFPATQHRAGDDRDGSTKSLLDRNEL